MLSDHISIFETELCNRSIHGRKNDEHILNDKIEIHFYKMAKRIINNKQIVTSKENALPIMQFL